MRMAPGEHVLVILDSNHSRAHVEAELELYAPLVSAGGYIVACDGIMAQRRRRAAHRAGLELEQPARRGGCFLARHAEFVLEEPAFPFNEGRVRDRVTYWPKASSGGWRETPHDRWPAAGA